MNMAFETIKLDQVEGVSNKEVAIEFAEWELELGDVCKVKFSNGEIFNVAKTAELDGKTRVTATTPPKGFY